MFYVPPHRRWTMPRSIEWSEEDEMPSQLELYERDSLKVRTDICETEESYLLKAELPGFKKENISVKTWDDTLFIMAEKEEEKSQEDVNYLRRERFHSSVSREYRINKNVNTDNIKAKYNHGILTVTLPKINKGMSTQREISIE